MVRGIVKQKSAENITQNVKHRHLARLLNTCPGICCKSHRPTWSARRLLTRGEQLQNRTEWRSRMLSQSPAHRQHRWLSSSNHGRTCKALKGSDGPAGQNGQNHAFDTREDQRPRQIWTLLRLNCTSAHMPVQASCVPRRVLEGGGRRVAIYTRAVEEARYEAE